MQSAFWVHGLPVGILVTVTQRPPLQVSPPLQVVPLQHD
jgi:hypothetical protein